MVFEERGKILSLSTVNFFCDFIPVFKERHCVESGEKYIPPRLRGEETVGVHKKEELERLKRHVKGLINR